MKPAFPQLPVVARELTELAQRKSTYRLRCLGLGIPFFVATMVLIIAEATANSPLDLIGVGYELHAALYITLLFVLYLLAPALSCSAITTEKEKQTLGLLLISRLTPLSLVSEKICSRMIPLLSLVIGAAPFFGVAFLLGGVTVADAVGAIVCLVIVTAQVTTVSICASAVMKSGVAAFWMSYLSLLLMYFGAPLLAEVGVLPFPGPSSLRDGWLFLFPPYQIEMLCQQWVFGTALNSSFDFLWLTVPSVVVSILFFVVGWRAVVRMGDSGGLTFQGLLVQVSPMRGLQNLTKPFSRWLPIANDNRVQPEDQNGIDASGVSNEAEIAIEGLGKNQIWSNFEAAYRPIFWRERLAMPLLRKRILAGVLVVAGLLFFFVWVNSKSYNQTTEAALFVLGGLVTALLVIMSLATRIFARERDQQTMESLLVIPMTNREILREKSAALNQAVWWLISPIILVACLSIVLTDNPNSSDPNATFFLCVFGHSLLYLHLVKWISLYFGLRMKTNMKAMVASLAAIIVLCTVLIAISVTALISSGSPPGDGLFWFYSSPVIVPMLGAFRDLSELYERNSMPDSGVLVVVLNLSIYFGVMLAVKTFTIRSLSQLLQRRDQDFESVGAGVKALS